MKTSMKVAVASASVWWVFRAMDTVIALSRGTGSPVGGVMSIAISILILIGLVKGHKLAWQWGRICGILGGVLVTLDMVPAVLLVAKGSLSFAFLVIGPLQPLALYFLFFALGAEGAREHFGLLCPKCGSNKAKGGDFFFNTAVCRSCGERW